MATLTPKQKLFARCVGGGMSLSDSYREAYSAKRMKPASIRVEASRLMSDPNITLMAKSIQGQKERAVVASAVSDGDKVLTHLRQWIDGEVDATPSQLRSADMLGRSCGLFKDVIETVVQRSPEEIRAELEALYAQHKDKPDQPDSAVH